MTDIGAKTQRASPSSVSKLTTRQSKQKRKDKASSLEEMRERVCAVLLELMCSSESDSVRVAAAKALMDKLKTSEPADEDDDKRRQEEKERAEVLDEARAILAAVETAKLSGAEGALSVDQDGSA